MAYLNGIEIDYQTISDNFSKSIAKYEIPYSNDPILQNLGQKTRSIKFRCYFFNERYEEHKELLSSLNDTEKNELEHPEYGLLTGEIETISVRKDEREETAEIDITFLVGSSDSEITAIIDAELDSEDLYKQGVLEVGDKLKKDLSSAVGEDIVGLELEEDGTLLDQIRNKTGVVSKFTNGVVNTIDDKIKVFEATLTTITTPANALINAIDFASDLPGRILGTIASTVAKYTSLYSSLVNFPDTFMTSLENGLSELKASIKTSSSDNESYNIKTEAAKKAEGIILTALASVIALEANLQSGYLLAENDDINADEVEKVLTVSRTLTNVAVAGENSEQVARENTVLKKFARVLLEYANDILLEKAKLQEIEVTNTVPLHLLCLHYNLPYTYADKILKVNSGLKNPSFCKGSMRIYAS